MAYTRLSEPHTLGQEEEEEEEMIHTQTRGGHTIPISFDRSSIIIVRPVPMDKLDRYIPNPKKEEGLMIMILFDSQLVM